MFQRKMFVLPILAIVLLLFIFVGKAVAPIRNQVPTQKPKNTAMTNTNSSFDMHANSNSSADSIWLIVNKQHQLNPEGYIPAHLVVPNIPLRGNISYDEKQVSDVVKISLESLVNTAGVDGVHLNLQSGYRSYAFQTGLYNGYVRTQGQATADMQSARPGYSEHQTGLAADLGGTTDPNCNIAQCFANTTEGRWLASHAYEYGFIIRYPADKESITGYEYEPWHVRYVGVALSTEMRRRGIETLEEFFNISGGAQYN